MNDSIKDLNLLIVCRQEEMLRLGNPKPEWIYSHEPSPFIPLRGPPKAQTNEIALFLAFSEFYLRWNRSIFSLAQIAKFVAIVYQMRNRFPFIFMLHREPGQEFSAIAIEIAIGGVEPWLYVLMILKYETLHTPYRTFPSIFEYRYEFSIINYPNSKSPIHFTP